MKKIFKRYSLYSVFAVLFIGIVFSCSKKDTSSNALDNETMNAKLWFESIYPLQAQQPIFQHVKYRWDKAKKHTFKNGYRAIVIPIEEMHYSQYRGKRLLYLFPHKNDKGYSTRIFEFIPTIQYHLAHGGKIRLNNFSGFLNSWNLKSGFIGGCKFENGIPISEVAKISVEVQEPVTQRTNTNMRSSGNTYYVTVVSAPNNNFYLMALINRLLQSLNDLVNVGGNPCEYGGCNDLGIEDIFSDEYFDDLQNMQDQEDNKYCDSLIKDSTNNPCISSVLAKLKSLSPSFPQLLRNIFNNQASIEITFKSGYKGTSFGAITDPNYTSNKYTSTINTNWTNASTFSIASTILHEMIHTQLMDWYRQAVSENDISTQEYLSTTYYLMFDSASISRYPELNFQTLMSYNQPGQHQIMSMGKFRESISSALYSLAHDIDPNTTIDELYCNDMAWTGLSDSQAWKHDLTDSERDRLQTIIEGERGNEAASPDYNQKGKPCP